MDEHPQRDEFSGAFFYMILVIHDDLFGSD